MLMLGPQIEATLSNADLVAGKIDKLNLDAGPTSLTGPFVAFFVTLPFEPGGSPRGFGFDIVATF